MATVLENYYGFRQQLLQRMSQQQITAGDLWLYGEILYRIGVLETCQMYLRSAPITNEMSFLVGHYQMLDAYVQNLARERRYRALLNRLTLAPDHRESLLRRGLTDEAIERLGYKSTPVVGFHALAQSLLDEGYTLFGVPGFYRDEDGRWTMTVWRRGILIPGTYFGKIQGFQIRLDHKMKKGGKFLTFSSRDELDGTMGENWCHMVGPVREKILLIEGYMKADIVHHFTGQTMLAIPGVTSLQHLEAALKDLIPLGVRHVMTCFDMDYLKNWHVENAYRNLVTLLGKLDITFGTYLWVPDHNGLDDYIWEFCLNQGKAPE